jgi:hypothetical protein
VSATKFFPYPKDGWSCLTPNASSPIVIVAVLTKSSSKYASEEMPSSASNVPYSWRTVPLISMSCTGHVHYSSLFVYRRSVRGIYTVQGIEISGTVRQEYGTLEALGGIWVVFYSQNILSTSMEALFAGMSGTSRSYFHRLGSGIISGAMISIKGIVTRSWVSLLRRE